MSSNRQNRSRSPVRGNRGQRNSKRGRGRGRGRDRGRGRGRGGGGGRGSGRRGGGRQIGNYNQVLDNYFR